MTSTVTVVEQIMNANDSLAAQNQAQLEANAVLGMNVMASPGSGKTSVILQTIEALKGSLKLGVVECLPCKSTRVGSVTWMLLCWATLCPKCP